jgi:hypothetical protein
MHVYFRLIIALTCIAYVCPAQQLPEGYILQYQQGFNGRPSMDDFGVRNPESWSVLSAGNNFYLHFAELPGIINGPTLPGNLAILNNRIFGDFILEADVMPEPDTQGFGEICIFLGIKDPHQFYCVQLANLSDGNHHGIVVVKKDQIKRLTAPDSPPVNWITNKWHKIRLERDIVKRTILVFVGDMKQPLLRVKDYELVMGSVGFGSYTGAGRIDNVRIWAPTVIRDEGQGTRDK